MGNILVATWWVKIIRVVKGKQIGWVKIVRIVKGGS